MLNPPPPPTKSLSLEPNIAALRQLTGGYRLKPCARFPTLGTSRPPTAVHLLLPSFASPALIILKLQRQNNFMITIGKFPFPFCSGFESIATRLPLSDFNYLKFNCGNSTRRPQRSFTPFHFWDSNDQTLPENFPLGRGNKVCVLSNVCTNGKKKWRISFALAPQVTNASYIWNGSDQFDGK